MELPEELLEEMDPFIGELFISIDKAAEQAADYGHSIEREYGWLAVHGFLHINGYDHYTPEEESEMFGLQEEILTAYANPEITKTAPAAISLARFARI